MVILFEKFQRLSVMKKIFLFSICVSLLIFCFPGCKSKQAKEEIKPDYSRPLPPGESALRKITNENMLPDFTLACLDTDGIEESIDNSLSYLAKPSSKRYFPKCDITHQRVVDSLNTMKQLLNSGLKGTALNQAIKRKFDVYISVGWDGKGTVLYTGYYTPIFEGSLTRSARYKYPLYKKPDNLVKNSDGKILGKRLSDGRIVPYPSRKVIEKTNMLKGKELVWLENAFEVYVAHVQGSAKIRLPNGELITVGYAANNGHEYKSIGKKLISDGVLTEGELSLSSMIKYFDKKESLVKKYTSYNPRFVFFEKQQGPPKGSLNEPVTPWRTIATDKSIFPRAALTFVSTHLPQYTNSSRIEQRVYSGFALDQDTGGAIRAPGRCDFYMGIGEKAGKLAGHTREEGKLYYLFVKDQQGYASR
jgi:membrane-bound lytic murein transglycosylase A